MAGLEYYDRPELWGPDSTYGDPAERERALTIRGYVPEGTRTLLDVGCGDGTVTNLLAEDLDVTGADISPRALEHARVAAKVAPAHDLPFEERSFDALLLAEVLEHLPDEEFDGARDEAARVAATTILVTVPNQEDMRSNELRCPRCGARFSPWRHHRRFAPGDFRGMFSGFRQELVEEIGPEMRFLGRLDGVLVRGRSRVERKLPFPAVCPGCGLKGVRPAGAEGGQPARSPLPMRLLHERVLPRFRPPARPRWLLARFTREQG